MALPRDAEVRPREHLREARELEDARHAAHRPRAEKRHRARTQAARRTGAGRARKVAAEGRREHARVVGHAGFELGDHLGRGALLRAVDRARALWAHERVVHVAHEMKVRLAHARVEAGDVNRGNAGQVGSTACELVAVDVQKARAERSHAAHATVVGSAAANGQRHVTCAGIERGADELAGAVGGREQRVLLARHKKREAGGGGHLYDSAPAGQHGVGSVDRAAQRVADAGATQLAAARRDERRGRAVTAVRHRDGDARAARKVPARRLFQQASRICRAQRALERVGRKDEPGGTVHGQPLVRNSSA